MTFIYESTRRQLASMPRIERVYYVNVFFFVGAVVYILDLFCNSSNIQTREAAAELLAKMSSDKLAGPKVKLDLSKFLPRLFSEAIRDAPKQCVHMFETQHENPELIWDDDAKARVARIIAELKDE